MSYITSVASGVPYVVPGFPTGVVGRSSAAKMNQSVSVRDFGALLDGVTDDHRAVANAVAYVKGTGKTLVFDGPACKIVGRIDLASAANMTIDFQQCVVSCAQLAGIDFLLLDGTSDVTVRGGYLTGLNNGNFLGTSNATGTPSSNIRLIDINASVFPFMLVFANGTHDVQVRGCNFGSSTVALSIDASCYAIDIDDSNVLTTTPRATSFSISGSADVSLPVNFASYGAVGDGVADDTLAIQSAINTAQSGATLRGSPGKTYKVTKNTALLPLVYPVRVGNTAGEQPCFAVFGKSNLTLDGRGATLNIGVHSQGILDILQSSKIAVQNFKFAGPGAFPPLDGTTGRSEKGVVGAGYYDPGAVANGPARNNSRDTSAFNTGGYGGAFPQLGGGTAATWGLWTGGGFIANTGNGVFIDDASTDIAVRWCEFSGFNGDGVQISSTLTESYGWVACDRVSVYGCYIHGCYNAGVEYHNASDVDINNNVINDCGHPNAALSDTVIDPGYGIASNNGTAPLRVTIDANTLKGNKRKGIDAHSIDTAVVTNNIVSDSGYGIMLVNGSGGFIRNMIVSNNLVERIAYPVGAQATGIYIEYNAGGGGGFSGNAVVSGNSVYEVGVPPGQTGIFPGAVPKGIGLLLAGTLNGVSVVGNLVQNSTYLGFIGLCSGFAGADTITGALVGNTVRGGWANGLNNLAAGSVNSATVANTVELTSIAPYAGAQTGMNGATDRFFSANNINVPAGQSFLSGTAQGLDLIVHVAMAAGAVTYTTGFDQSKFVLGVASIANGLQITLASGIAVQAVTFAQTSSSKAVVTAGSVTLDYVYIRNEANPVQVGLQAAGVDRAANACTGAFTFRISI